MEMVHRLQERLREAKQAMEDARRTNDILKAQVNDLTQENERLLLTVPPSQPPAVPAVIPPTVFHGAPATQAPQVPPLILHHHTLAHIAPQHTINVLAQSQQSLAAVQNLK